MPYLVIAQPIDVPHPFWPDPPPTQAPRAVAMRAVAARGEGGLSNIALSAGERAEDGL